MSGVAGGNLRPGELIAGRYRLRTKLPDQGELSRWEAEDPDGARVEVVGPQAHVLLRPGVKEAFLSTATVEHPAALPVYWQGLMGGLPLRVRGVTTGTLAGRRLTVAEAHALAGWLGTSVDATPQLSASDIVLDQGGVPRLAPTGIPPSQSVARAAHVQAPEGVGPVAGRYGLGVLLHEAVTGRRPEGPPATGDAAFDATLTALLGPPADRRLPAAAPPPTFAPPAEAPPSSAVPAPVPERVRLQGRYVVAVPIRDLSAEDRARALDLSGVDPNAWSQLADKPALWPVEVADTPQQAALLLRRFAGLSARVVDTGPAWPLVLPVLGAMALLGASIFLPYLLLGVLALLVVFGAGLRRARATITARAGLEAWTEAAARSTDPSPAGRRRALRRQLRSADLPAVIAADLRSDLEAAEDDARLRDVETRFAQHRAWERDPG